MYTAVVDGEFLSPPVALGARHVEFALRSDKRFSFFLVDGEFLSPPPSPPVDS